LIFNIYVHADNTSWPGGIITNSGLASAANSWHQYRINYLNLLHMIGFLTVPSNSRGVSLAEYWAQLRYLHVPDYTTDNLIVRDEYENIDPHQKTILSDDFGIGISMYWLISALNILPGQVCDGLYFYKNMAGRFGATVCANGAVNGAQKTPDFVAPDQNNKWHVIECKGTQGRNSTRNSQFGRTDVHGTPLDGGRAQKRTIHFPHQLAGEQLVAGVKIATKNNDNITDLKIMDPESEPVLKLNDQTIEYVYDPVYRNTTSKLLTMMGASELAAQFLSPQGILEAPLDQSWDERDDFLKTRRKSVFDEYKRLTGSARQHRAKPTEIRRELRTMLARPIEWASRSYKRATLSIICPTEFIDQSFEVGQYQEPFKKNEPYWSEVAKNMEYHSNIPVDFERGPKKAEAEISFGKFFKINLELRE
jgi:hypothetical protein